VVRAVADASAVAALMFGEPEADAIAEGLGGEDLAAPWLLPFEVANVAAMKLRRRSATRRALEAGLGMLPRLGIALYPASALDLLAIADRSGLTAHDAAYLALAAALDADLVTLDRKLERAWRTAR